MAFSVKVGSFAANTSTGNQAVSGVGFQPKAVLFFLAGGLTSDGSAPNFDLCVGFGVSSTQRAVMSLFSDDGAASSDSARQDTLVRCIGRISASAAVNGFADVVSMDADGFTIDWTTAPGAAWIVQYLALGGDDLTNVAVKTFMSPTSTGNVGYTGVGFQPDCLIVAGATTPTAGAHATNMLGSFGFALSSSARAALGVGATDAAADAVTNRRLIATKVITTAFNDAEVVGADLVSMDADGFTLNWNPTIGSTARNYYALCLKGGQYKIGVETQNTSTGTKATTGVGFQPTGLLLAGVCNTSTTSVVANSRITIGFADGASEGNLWAGDQDAAANMVADHALSRTKVLRHLTEGTPTLDAEADLSSFDADGFTLDWTTADATAREFAYLAFGSEGGGDTTITLSPLAVSVAPVAPTITVGNAVSLAALAVSVAPVAPALTVATIVAPAPLTLDVEPVAPSLSGATLVEPDPLALDVEPVAPALATGQAIALAPLTVQVAPVAPALSWGHVVTLTPVTVRVVPVAPVVVSAGFVGDPLFVHSFDLTIFRGPKETTLTIVRQNEFDLYLED